MPTAVFADAKNNESGGIQGLFDMIFAAIGKARTGQVWWI